MIFSTSQINSTGEVSAVTTKPNHVNSSVTTGEMPQRLRWLLWLGLVVGGLMFLVAPLSQTHLGR